MRIKNSVSSSNRDTPKYVVERRSRRLVLSILTAGLVLGILIASFLSVESGLAAGAVADEPCLSCPLEANAEEREADFYFLDHELAFFGRKASASIAEKERGADFYFLDHELAFFGRKASASIAEKERGADFYFLDHELAFFGRKASASIAEKERGADFYFLDHELAFFGR